MDQDLREQLRRIAASVPPPAVAPREIGGRARRRLARSLVTALATLTLVAGGGVTAWRSLGSREGLVGPHPGSSGEGTVESSATTQDGALRCTSRMPAVLHPGRPIAVMVTLENLVDRSVEYPGRSHSVFEVTAPDGRILLKQDPVPGLMRGGLGAPQTLAPDERADLLVFGAHEMVRWDGGLNVAAECVIDEHLVLPAMAVRVQAPPNPPSREEAVRRALQARPGLLDRCVPKADGPWTIGELTSPRGTWFDGNKQRSSADLPPLTARCSAAVTEHDGFVEVALRVVAPADAPDFPFPDMRLDEFIIRGDPRTVLPGDGSIGLMRWTLVVTDERVYDSGYTERADRTRAPRQHTVAPELAWSDGAWLIGYGSSACGGTGNGFVWISLCSP